MNQFSWLKNIRYSLVVSALYLLILLVLALPNIPFLRVQLLDLVPGYGYTPSEEYVVTPADPNTLPALSLAGELRRRLADTDVAVPYFTVTVQGNSVKVLVPQDDEIAATLRSLLIAQGEGYFAISNARLDEVDQEKDIFYFYTGSNYQKSIIDSSDINNIYVRRDTSNEQVQQFLVLTLTDNAFQRFRSLNTTENANKVLGLWVDGTVLPIGVMGQTFFDSFTDNTVSVPLVFGLSTSRYLISVLQGPTLPTTVNVVGPNSVQPWFDFKTTWLVIITLTAMSILALLALTWRHRNQAHLVLIGSFALLNIPLLTIVISKLTQRPVTVFTVGLIIAALMIILSLVGIMVWVDSRKKLTQRHKQWRWFSQRTSQLSLFLLLLPTAALLFTVNPFVQLAAEAGWQIVILVITWWWLQWLHQTDYGKKTA